MTTNELNNCQRYKNISVEDPKGRHQEPFVKTQGILDHRNGRFVRPNRVALKYPNFKKDVNLDVHVKVFNFVVKASAIFLKNIS